MDLILFVVALSVLVLVHELGHFLAARLTGVRVDEFGLGLPPRIAGKRWLGTIWSLNWLPIGGFCKLYGEDPPTASQSGGQAALKNKNQSFYFKQPWQKGLVVVGGVLMNVILAIVIFTTVYAVLGLPVETRKVRVIGIAKGSPAAVGLSEGDWVVKVNDIEIWKPEELTKEVGKYKGSKVNLWVENNNGRRWIQVEVRENPPKGEGAMGIAISNTEMVKMKWWQFYKGVLAGFKEAYFWGKIIADGVGKMIVGVLTGQVPKDVSGPIGMYQATTSIKKDQGMLAVVHFFGVVSVNLAVVNILPFPALDGGRIIFVIYEMVFRKRANQKFEAVVNNLGMIVLLSLILLITVSDVVRIIKR